VADYRMDPGKAAENRRRHGVEFDDAIAALLDPLKVGWFDEAHSGDEPRFVTLGRDLKGRLLAVVTSEGDTPRIISARRATKRERHAYEEHSPIQPGR
jgi:uncharacterized DUF497 family protein